MNSSSLARSAASSFERPAASYCSGVIAFSSPGKPGVSGSAAGSDRRKAQKRERNKTNCFIGLMTTYSTYCGPECQSNPARLLQIVNLDQADADVPILAGEDRGELAGREGGKDAR